MEPAILRAGPGAVAYVIVRLEDGAGQAVIDEEVTLEATEGEIGELRARPDGTLVATFTPAVTDRPREVEITARTESIRTSTHLALEPRVVQFSFGPWVGGHSNLGILAGPAGGVDVDVRLRAPGLGESLIWRTAAVGMGLRAAVNVEGVSPSVDVRMTVVPISTMLLFRQDGGPWAVWAGGGGTVAPQFSQNRIGGRLMSSGYGLLGGPAVTAGASRRAPGGEVIVTVLGMWLPAPRKELGFSGNLGGLMGGIGYRLVY